jgi:hypothetical protein
MKRHLSILSVILLVVAGCGSEETDQPGPGPGRFVRDLSGQEWNLWLDEKASWENDPPYLPPVDIEKIDANPPTGGWKELRAGPGIGVTLPATVEEYFWGREGDPSGDNGDITGVSWFTTTFEAPEELEGRRIVLDFESVRMRAEVYVNEKLAGYDLVYGTPFRVDITDQVEIGAGNFLAVRITDPNGNFTWKDFGKFEWGSATTPPGHGFGGITGPVKLVATDPVFIDDLFVKNRPEMTGVDVEVTLANTLDEQVSGEIVAVLSKTGDEIEAARAAVQGLKETGTYAVTLSHPEAEPWSPDSPTLYEVEARWEGEDGGRDAVERSFGFRWFEVKEVDGDRQFYLNGKRIVLVSAISWGFWPKNGSYATDELAEKQVAQARALGLNMLNLHRCMGKPNILQAADRLGLLIYQEPGGYGSGKKDASLREWNRRRMARMIRRDRSHPSLVIYNMINESGRDPDPHEIEDIKYFHELDETRVITFTSSHFPADLYGGKCPVTPAPIKSHLLPYDHTVHEQGWWDEHHAFGPGSYISDLYDGPTDYYPLTENAPEIVFYGEEAAIGTPERVSLIKEKIEGDEFLGWDGDDYLRLFDVYDRFLTERGFREAFPTVSDLTRSMGNVAYYNHGRSIETIRVNNLADGYVINGWEGQKLENHSGMVDCHRNLKGDPEVLARYNRPRYLAVKAREKVLPAGTDAVFDVYIVNQDGLSGEHVLEVTYESGGNVQAIDTRTVTVEGGDTYGQLLADGLSVAAVGAGYTEIRAVLKSGDTVEAEGHERVFAAMLAAPDNPAAVSVADTGGLITPFLQGAGYGAVTAYKDGKPNDSVLLAGPTEVPVACDDAPELLDWLKAGNRLVVVEAAGAWAAWLSDCGLLTYGGEQELGKNWLGGHFFVREHPLFADLPVDTAFNWEYQSFAKYWWGNRRFALRIAEGEIVVGAVSSHQPEVLGAVVTVPVEEGEVILSTLDIMTALADGRPATATARKLLLNYLAHAGR